MTTATRTRKPATKKARTANILRLAGCPDALCLMEDGKLTMSYTLEPLASDFGVAFTLRKAYMGHNADGGTEYQVLLHGKESSCTCPGNTYRGHCKHVDALTALVQSGKLAVKEPEPIAEPEEEETVDIQEQPPQPNYTDLDDL